MPATPQISRATVSFGVSLAICSVLNALLVVAKEKSHAVQTTMQHLTGSHWITHALVILIIFFALGFAPIRFKRGEPASRLIKTILPAIAAASAIIIGFYLTAG